MKKDFRRDRCMASGILLGRVACGVAALHRAVAEPDPWSAAFTVSTTARPMMSALRGLETSLRKYSPKIRTFAQMLEPLTEASGSSFNRDKVSAVTQQLMAGLNDLGKMALEACGKRRPGDDDGDKLLRTRRKATRKDSP